MTIRPTTTQIQNSSRLIRYGDIVTPLSDTCPISLEPFQQDDSVYQLIHCSHIFGQTPFQQWFANNVRCPVCRYDIRNYTVPSETPTNNFLEPRLTRNVSESNLSVPQISPIVVGVNDALDQGTEQNDIFSNFNINRNPNSNEIDNITFDITNNTSNTAITNIASRLFQSILQRNRDDDDSFMFDPSNNILFYETILRPNNRNSRF